MISLEKMQKIDASQMYDIIRDFPKQAANALEIAKAAKYSEVPAVCNKFLVLGMGGSAIGGTLLGDFFENSDIKKAIDVKVCRDYYLPKNIDENTNIIVSSYSGNTEETLTALIAAHKITNRITCITTGGKLKEYADENNLPYIEIPGGLQPRAALGYSIIPMIYIVINSGLLSEEEKQICEKSIIAAINALEESSKTYSALNDNNSAYQIADSLVAYVPVIYSSNRYTAANLRWRGQIQENAKTLSFGNFLPEMNHNEINSFTHPAEMVHNFAIILFKDKKDNPRTQIRIEAVNNLLKDKVHTIIELEAEAEDYFTNAMEFIYLGDWVSYYLAVIQGIDPTPIPLINELKTILANAKQLI